MPRKNSIKNYIENGYYHIYNRGVEKKDIFKDEQDYKVFLFNLKRYLSPTNILNFSMTGVTPVRKRPIKTVYGLIQLLTYCLMPNHFHLLIKQSSKDGITKLMNRIGTNYGMYFNKKYNRVGPLFQSVYKAVLIDTEGQLLHVSRYIHMNPMNIENDNLYTLDKYPYSSYQDYLGLRQTTWIYTEEILDFFVHNHQKIKIFQAHNYLSYKEFVEGDIDSLQYIDTLTME